jgi:hypothetical protein
VAKEFLSIDESLRDFIREQGAFFVATAPSEGGRINLSPRGYRDAEFARPMRHFGDQHAGVRTTIVVDGWSTATGAASTGCLR